MTSAALYPGLRDRVAIVTGGATGIGAEIAGALASQGAAVGIIDIQADKGRALARSIGERAAFAEADIRDVPALRSAIDRVRAALGPVDILVNNAADDRRHSVESVTPEDWDNGIAVNVKHHFFAAQAVLPDMKRTGRGSIVNLSSTSWLQGLGGMPVYISAKAAVAGLTRALARDFGPFGIRVNTVVPGWIMTEKQLEQHVGPEDHVEILKRQCIKRPLSPADVAGVVLFLASDASSACTSQSFVVDGGWT